MTTDRELLQQALDYLKKQRDYANEFDVGGYGLIEKIEARLAQPEQEPVAWGYFKNNNFFQSFVIEGFARNHAKNKGVGEVRPLYTHSQPERKPLTDVQILEILDITFTPLSTKYAIYFANAIMDAMIEKNQ